MNVAIIGGGAMGSALARGLAGNDAFQVKLSTPHPGKIDIPDIITMADNTAAVRGAALVVIAVKPWVLPDVIREIAPAIDPVQTEVSVIVAGVSGADIREMFGVCLPGRLSIAMPNTAMVTGTSMTFMVQVCGECRDAISAFKCVGSVKLIDERQLPAATALASCGIAYALRYIRAASEGGVELGFKASDAQAIVVATLKGVVSILETNPVNAEVEIDKVTTPGGLTIRGLNAMEKAGFSAAVIEGLRASVR